MKRKVIALCLALLLLVTSVSAIQYYNEEDQTTSGGTSGTIKVKKHVYKEQVSYSGYTVTYYGIEGYVTEQNPPSTTWISKGYLFKTNSSTHFAEQSQTTTLHKRYSGLTCQEMYNSYTLYLRTSDSYYGSSSYTKNGNF